LNTEIRSERVRANGLDFHVNACGEGERLALCLHGFPELGLSWRHQLPLLASLGYRAWAPDLRGYGQSDRPKGVAHYAIEALLDDVAGLIDAAEPSETVLVAHDWGALIAWQFTAHAVRPLDRLVILNGPPPGIPERPSLGDLRRFAYVLFFQIPRLPERAFARHDYAAISQAFRRVAGRPERLEQADLDRFRAAAAEPGAMTAMIDYYRGLVRGGGMRRMKARGFPTIETPTLMIWGDADPVLIPATTDDAGRWVKDVTRRFVPGVGHWVQQEAPDEVNEILSAWLKDAPVPGNLHWELR
jgi:pimeloyl-ACP methyl ester carboxylesterase